MKILNYIFVFTMLISVNSFAQNQNMLGTMYATKNIFRDTLVDPLKRLTINKKKYFNKKNHCGESELITIDKDNSAVKLGDHIANKCLPWSYEKSCGCEFKCPKDVSIIQSPFYKGLNVEAENDFSFRNDPDAFKNTKHKMTNGYCWGHPIGTQRFNRMGLFSKDHQLKIDGEVIDKSDKRYEKEIKRGIRRILRNKVAEFPGFANLQELSITPPYDEYIKNKVANKWANEAMSFSGIGIALNSKVDKAKRIEKRLDHFKDRVDQGLSSQFIFTAKDLPGVTHAVLVYDYKVEGNKTTLCIQDNNEAPSSNEKCGNPMTFEKTENGYEIIYPAWKFPWGGKIGGFNLNIDEDYDTIKQIKSLRRYCIQSLCNKQEQTLLQEIEEDDFDEDDKIKE